MTKNKLYSLLLIACLTGIVYLFFTIYNLQNETFRVCVIKSLTGYPCPSCGTTRAVSFLIQGKIIESLLINPFGILVATIMFVFPFWIIADVILKKESFFKWFKKTETTIRKPWVASILIAAVITNWIWNIYKHL